MKRTLISEYHVCFQGFKQYPSEFLVFAFCGVIRSTIIGSTYRALGPRHVGGCQNYGPFLDPYYNTAPNIKGTQERTINLTTTLVSGPKPQEDINL